MCHSLLLTMETTNARDRNKRNSFSELANRNKAHKNVEAGAGSADAGAMSLWFLFRCGQFGGMEQRRQLTAL